MSKKSTKGFTLMELLVVIAIIIVLVAISIPIFLKQLEKSRETADIANMRDAKAAIATAYLAEDITPGQEYFYDAESGKLVTGTAPEGYGKGTQADGKRTYSVLSSCKFEPAEKSCTYVSTADYREAYLVAFVTDEGQPHVHWVNAGGSDDPEDPVDPAHGDGTLYSIFKGLYATAKDFLVFDSNRHANGTLNQINAALAEANSDIKTWSIICDNENASDPKDPDKAYYLFSTHSTTNSDCKKQGLTAGSQVPAIMQCPDGTFQVGYATLYHEDTNYYSFSRDADGNARNIGSKTNPAYDVNTVLSDKKIFNSLDDAYSYYNGLDVRK